MDSKRYRFEQQRFTHPKPYRADAVFPPPEKGNFKRTQAFTFTGEKGRLELKLLKPQRNICGIELTHLFMVNPYVSVSNINCCLSYYIVTAASGATPLASGSPVTHYIILENGDYDPTEFVQALNDAFFQRHGREDFVFSYDKDATHKLTLTNNHATDTFYVPSKTNIDAQLSASPLNNTVGSLWASLGFAVDAADIELRATDARTANVGQNSAPATLPATLTNNSDISFLIPEDDPAADFSALTGNFPPGLPMNVSGKTALVAEQFMLYNNPFSMTKSKKCIYLVAKGMDTNHDIVSCAGTTQLVRRRRTVASGTVVNGVKTDRPTNVEEKATAYAPSEGSVNIESVLAVIPVISGMVDLQSFSTKKIDLSKNPIANFKNMRLELIDDNNNVVDMRGRSITATITVDMMY